MFSDSDVKAIFRQYPPVDYAVAYGSGVLEQAGYDYSAPAEKLPMIDMIFAVEDAKHWHKVNMTINKSHYGSDFPMSFVDVATMQDSSGGGLWYNAYVPLNIPGHPERVIKYGVMSTAALQEDLLHWSRGMYAAGRLHKPVLLMQGHQRTVLQQAMRQNFHSALCTALLLLPQRFSESCLFRTVAALSYTGDPRMAVAEHPRKVTNLVQPQLLRYRELYKNTLESLLTGGCITDGSNSTGASRLKPVLRLETPTAGAADRARVYVQQYVVPHDGALPLETEDMTIAEGYVVPTDQLVRSAGVRAESNAMRHGLLLQLPVALRKQLYVGPQHVPHDSSQVHLYPTPFALQAAVGKLVGGAATTQSLKGLLSAGVVRSAQYAFMKVLKRLK